MTLLVGDTARSLRRPSRWLSNTRERGIERLLVAVGVICLGTALAAVAEGQIYQFLGRWQLLAAESENARVGFRSPARLPDPVPASATAAGTPTAGTPTAGTPAAGTPAAGTPVGTISIPELSLKTVILEGVGEDVLRRGIGHFPQTAMPGAGGNAALAGHRDTFFRALRNVRVGQRVVLTTADGLELAYRVESTEVVEPTQIEVLDDPGYEVLTLITCYPFRFFGPAPQRFVVRCRPDPDAIG